MARKLDDNSRDLLLFRPNIYFIEPDQEEQEITPIQEDPQLEEILAERQQVKKLAEAVNALATALQARVDDKAKDVSMKLDPLVDGNVIQCMKVVYPDDSPTEITFAQYKQCKDSIRQLGIDVAKKIALDPVAVQKARDAGAGSSNASTQMGGYNTPESKNGGLRPELQTEARIIEPIDLEEFQLNMICILSNHIWKNLIKPILDKAGIPFPINLTIGSLLPDELCKPTYEGPKPPGLQLLDDKKKKKKKKKQDAPPLPPAVPEGVG